MRRFVCIVMVGIAGVSAIAGAQIRVNPTGVSINVQNATTVFLTYGGLRDQVAAEAFWCGELLPATSAIGSRCDPETIFGRAPLRYDLLRTSGHDAVTDIMSIPPSVARRAYQEAERGKRSTFFFVRRFESLVGGPDVYVAVTCRLTGGGARTPFALTDVALSFDPDATVLFLQPGQRLAPISARIAYNGTGRLKGRWEVVLPGEEPPGPSDLLTEATLPLEERASQRRFTELERFNVFLPPGGTVRLAGPDTARLPTTMEGTYLVLLRIEADDERESDSDLAAVGAGDVILHSGAVAGFPLPVLRYVVGSGSSELAPARSPEALALLAPAPDERVPVDSLVELRWIQDWRAAVHRVELAGPDGVRFEAFVRKGVGRYRVPPFAWQSAAARGGAPGTGMEDRLRWRVIALDAAGRPLRASEWREIRLGAASAPARPSP